MTVYGFPTANSRVPAPVRSGSMAGPKYVSFALAATALYGDLLKRVLPGTVAVALLYAISAVILLAMILTGRRRRTSRTPLISTLAGMLMLTYFLQFCTGFEVDLLPALMMFIYVCIPLAIIFIIPSAYPEFDIRALAQYTMILIVPIHMIGIVQHFIDPHFMVSTAYSEMGGVIVRNFLEGTDTFQRLPSLFASADRYAGVSAMQVFLSFMILSGQKKRQWRSMLWLAFNLVSAAGGLMISGARSRILIAAAALLVAGIALLFKLVTGQMSNIGKVMLSRAAIVAGLALAGALSFESVRDHITDMPVVTILAQTADKGDVQGRFQAAVDISMVPDGVKFFGEGLGVSGSGRPGEFGVRAMWIEGGFFWTVIMLIIHAGILLAIVRGGIRATLTGNAMLSMALTGGGTFWLFGLLAGLSSAFELSLALLLFPMIATAAVASNRQRAAKPRLGAGDYLGWGLR